MTKHLFIAPLTDDAATRRSRKEKNNIMLTRVKKTYKEHVSSF